MLKKMTANKMMDTHVGDDDGCRLHSLGTGKKSTLTLVKECDYNSIITDM